jgi:hypothetical protein
LFIGKSGARLRSLNVNRCNFCLGNDSTGWVADHAIY